MKFGAHDRPQLMEPIAGPGCRRFRWDKVDDVGVNNRRLHFRVAEERLRQGVSNALTSHSCRSRGWTHPAPTPVEPQYVLDPVDIHLAGRQGEVPQPAGGGDLIEKFHGSGSDSGLISLQPRSNGFKSLLRRAITDFCRRLKSLAK